jgi:hypothetical protein
MSEQRISFYVSGYAVQTVKLENGYTVEQVVEMLNDGRAITTIQEGGSIDITENGKKIGTVECVDESLEYTSFQVH